MHGFRFRRPAFRHTLYLAAAGTCVLLRAQGAQAATIHVTTTTPDATNDGQCSLFEAVYAAESNSAVDSCESGSGLSDTIDIPAGTYEILIPASAGLGLPHVTTNIVFRGAGSAATIIQRASNAPSFTLVQVDTPSTFEGLTLKGGRTNGGAGAAILGAPGVSLTLTDVVVTGSRGGVAWWPAVGVVTNCKFVDNEGAISTRFDNTSPLDIEGSIFEDNVAAGQGALSVTGPITITDSIFRGNGTSSGGGGGAIDSLTDLTIRGSLFEGNQAAQGSGGAIRSAGTLDIATSAFVSNGASYGGAVWLEGGNIVNATFSGNSATVRGGAIGVSGSATLIVNNVTLAANQSAQGGGLVTSSAGALVLSNSALATNTSPDGADCATLDGAVISSGGYNFIGVGTGCAGFAATTGDQVGLATPLDPRLAVLSDDAGSTPTHALLDDSPLRDTGHPGSGGGRVCENTDQLGTARPLGPRCDIGAFEAEIVEGAGGAAGADAGGASGAATGGNDAGGGDAGGNDAGGGDAGGAPSGAAGDRGSAGRNDGSSGEAGAGEEPRAGRGGSSASGGSGNRGGSGGRAGNGGSSSGRGGSSGSSGAAGSAGSGSGSTPDSSGGGGCGCRVAPARAPGLAPIGLLLAGLAFGARRLRARSHRR